ncbi:hypothetical protein [Mesorhizobium sp.]|uniref:hypothetical protein n=1 Tax=Mesorhizobium sp. TaxID=1871066 RepID=UPI00257ABE48|nr:hypothetical protein [Mesorhizobium sp.]
MVVGQTESLAGNRFGDFGAAVPDVDAIKAGEPVDQVIAMRILDMPLPVLTMVGSPSCGKILELRERMQDSISILFADVLDVDSHTAFLSVCDVTDAHIFGFEIFGETMS